MKETKRFVVITTIFPPSGAVRSFSKLIDWQLIVAGDRKTPSDWSCGPALFLSLGDQERSDFSLGKALPQNHYCRKMMGYLKAMELGADSIADTDDDNLPKPRWGFPDFDGSFLVSGSKPRFVNIYRSFTDMHIWPRGFPLDLLSAKESVISEDELSEKDLKVGVWQGLADGDPDVDAVYRLTSNEPCTFNVRREVVLGNGYVSPFNSQNTMFRRELFPLLYLPGFVTFRFTDILRSLVAQPIMWSKGYLLGFSNATVVQERNPHDYMRDFESEIPCYLHSKKAVKIVSDAITPDSSIAENLREAYRALLKNNIVVEKEIDLLSAWLRDLEGLGIG